MENCTFRTAELHPKLTHSNSIFSGEHFYSKLERILGFTSRITDQKGNKQRQGRTEVLLGAKIAVQTEKEMQQLRGQILIQMQLPEMAKHMHMISH
jgi:hypothetical protein